MVFSSKPHGGEDQIPSDLSDRVSVGQLYDSGTANFRVKFMRTREEVDLIKASDYGIIYRERQERANTRLHSRNSLMLLFLS